MAGAGLPDTASGEGTDEASLTSTSQPQLRASQQPIRHRSLSKSGSAGKKQRRPMETREGDVGSRWKCTRNTPGSLHRLLLSILRRRALVCLSPPSLSRAADKRLVLLSAAPPMWLWYC
jgi:hypothetical protein